MPLERSNKKFEGSVLVVDDNWITLKLIEKMLQSFGLVTTTIDSGTTALDMMSANKYDLVFLDCSMPELDGHQVAREIRRRETGNASRMKLIAFTADDSRYNRKMCEDSGMDGLFPKPYSYTSLEELLTEHLRSVG